MSLLLLFLGILNFFEEKFKLLKFFYFCVYVYYESKSDWNQSNKTVLAVYNLFYLVFLFAEELCLLSLGCFISILI